MSGAGSAAGSLVDEAVAVQDANLAAAQTAIDEAMQLAELGAYTDATNLLNQAAAGLTLNTSTAGMLEDLQDAKAEVIYIEATALAGTGDAKGAEQVLLDYLAAGGDSSRARQLADQLDATIRDPYALDINKISPDYVAASAVVRDLLTKGVRNFSMVIMTEQLRRSKRSRRAMPTTRRQSSSPGALLRHSVISTAQISTRPGADADRGGPILGAPEGL